MKMFLAAGAACLAVCAIAPQAQAASRYYSEVRQLNNQINLGVKDGSLTPSEARDLRLKLIDAEVKEAHDTRGGTYTPGIDQDLAARYASISADIHAQRINDQRVIIRHKPAVRRASVHRPAHHAPRRPVHAVVHKTVVVHKAVAVHKK